MWSVGGEGRGQGPEGSQGLQGRGPKCEFGVVGIAGGRGSQPALIDVARAGWCAYVGEPGVVKVRDRDGMDSDTAVGGP